MLPEKIKIQKYSKISKGTKNVRIILTFFVPFPFSTSLNFSIFFGNSHGLNIVQIGSLHLRGVQMISGKIKIQKY